MNIDEVDLKIIRKLEDGEIRYLDSVAKDLGIGLEEISQRVKRIEESGVIQDYKSVIFIPAYEGGDWVLGCARIITKKSAEEVALKICQKIPFVTEIIFTNPVPFGVGPNLSLLFYSRDLKSEERFLKEISEIDYLETFPVADYSFPLALVFSSEEKALMAALVNYPKALNDELIAVLSRFSGTKSQEWIVGKIEKILLSKTNPQGVIQILPEIDWQRVDNYAHIHFFVESQKFPKRLWSEAQEDGFRIVSPQRLFKERFEQFETDLWGFSDFFLKKNRLEVLTGLKVQGCTFAGSNRIINDWAKKLIKNS